jgi:antitoxin CcdA
MRTPKSTAPKQATNLSINRDLLNAAREAGVNLSAALEEALQEKVAAARREQWRRENADAIAEYNDLVAEHGTFSEGQRSF